jgi:hypothetical protein
MPPARTPNPPTGPIPTMTPAGGTEPATVVPVVVQPVVVVPPADDDRTGRIIIPASWGRGLFVLAMTALLIAALSLGVSPEHIRTVMGR